MSDWIKVDSNQNETWDYTQEKEIQGTYVSKEENVGPNDSNMYNFITPSCKERGVNARVADVLVWQGISGLMSDPKLIKEQVKRYISDKQVSAGNSSNEKDELVREIDRLRKEENRYIKAYGGEVISEEQFKDAIMDLKSRRAVLERQVGHLESQKQEADDIMLTTDQEIDEFCEAAKFVLNNKLNFNKKQFMVQKSVDTIIGEQRRLRVRGYLSGKEMFNNYVKSRSECRDSQDINEHSVRGYIPFELKFRLPKLRKERIISDRDMFGKIVLSKVPKRRLFR